jgi:TPR repeat protein
MLLERITPEEAVRIAESGNDDGVLSSAYFYAGEFYLLKKNKEKAIEYYRKASVIKTDWTDPIMSRNRLSNLLGKLNKNGQDTENE